jgi:uncharacterized protein YcfJ
MNQIKETASAYTKGAVVGGVIGAVFALATKRGLILWTTIGIVGGGFIAHRMSDAQSKETNFKNYDK